MAQVPRIYGQHRRQRQELEYWGREIERMFLEEDEHPLPPFELLAAERQAGLLAKPPPRPFMERFFPRAQPRLPPAQSSAEQAEARRERYHQYCERRISKQSRVEQMRRQAEAEAEWEAELERVIDWQVRVQRELAEHQPIAWMTSKDLYVKNNFVTEIKFSLI